MSVFEVMNCKQLRIHREIYFLIALLLCISPTMRSQSSSAQLSGTVSDATGAIVTGASVKLTNVGTGVSNDAVTNASGVYTFSFVAPGAYSLVVSANGFSTAKETGINLQVADVRAINVTLAVGGISTTVTTTANIQLINTLNSEVSQTIDTKQVEDIPLNGRNFQQLITLGDGAYSTSGGASSQYRPQMGNSDIGMAGGRYNSVNYMIDGMGNRDVMVGSPVLFPSVEALQEFKEQTGTYSAQFGGSAQQVNINFKTGTNTLHGSGYDFLRNEALDAHNYFDLAGSSKPKLRRNQFGYSLGGPIYIPKLYDGRNRTFFFANYEGLRQKEDDGGYVVVPDPTILAGQFSSTIIDPTTNQPFPDNKIPDGRISAFAKAYNKFWLTPNVTSTNGNYYGVASAPVTSDQQNYRFDENLSSKNQLYFRYSWSEYNGTTGGNVGTGTTAQSIYHAGVRSYSGGWTTTISDSLVNQARFGYLSTVNDQVAHTIPEDAWKALGITGGYTDITAFELPSVSFRVSGIYGGTDINFPTIDHTNFWDASDAVILTKGRHTLSTGFSWRNWTRQTGKGANLGNIVFNGGTTGDEFADYLLGLPYTITLPQPTPLSQSASQIAFKFPQFQFGPYVEDQWKVNSRLSVTAGIRYDFFSISREAEGRWSWLDPTVSGGGLCVGYSKWSSLGINSNLEHRCGDTTTPNGAPRKNFAPRVSFAWQPKEGGRTVIRSGFGMFFDTPEENDDVNMANVYPFYQNGEYTTDPGVSQVDLSKALPTVTTLSPVTPDQLGFVFGAAKKLASYSSQWSLAIERDLGHGTIATASYLGSHSVHLPSRYIENQSTYYDPEHPSSAAARNPYPNFGYLFSQTYAPDAKYEAGTIKVRHQSNGLDVLSSFTWSRVMDEISAAFGVGNASSDGGGGWAGISDAYDPHRDYARGSIDINKRFVASFSYDLPFGRGKQHLSQVNRAVDAALGGWKVAGVVTAQDGLPYSIFASDTNGLIMTYNQRADLVHSPYPSGFKRSAHEWFDTTAFAQPAPGIYGTSRRDILLSPYHQDWDLSLFKNFPVQDRLNLQFRAEAFNAFNHVRLGTPDTNVNSSIFGVINGASDGRIMQVAGKFVW
ncbi:MAG: carboxypeptidase regulatory-like domain-containing protein [Terracidiphilus sp.]|nr:carboxypeptidase regulatory-like domain-containing protein [Terracidiphilus sp.]